MESAEMVGGIVLIVNASALPSELSQTAAAACAEIRRVTTGEQAAAMALTQTLVMAIISHKLPDMPCEKLLSIFNDAPRPVPAIVVADNFSSEEVIAAFRAGARDCVQLPARDGELRQRVQQLLSEPAATSPHTGRAGGHSAPPPANLSANGAVSVLQNLVKFMRGALPMAAGSCRQSVVPAISANGHNGVQEFFHGNGDNHVTALYRSKPPSDNPALAIPHNEHDTTPIENSISDSRSSAGMQIHALGKFRVIIGGKTIEKWPSRKGRGVFAYLALHRNRRIHKDVLMENFWPHATPSSARNSLNVALHGVRRALQRVDPDGDYVLFQDECYCMNPEVETWLDVDEFNRCWRRAHDAERRQQPETELPYYLRAAQLFGGDFMEEETYENWAACERDNLRERYLVVLDKLTQHYVQRGRFQEAIPWCEAALAKDCCREDLHRRLMKCYERLGKRSLALRQFQKCSAALWQELEAEPAAATVRLFDEIRRDRKKDDGVDED